MCEPHCPQNWRIFPGEEANSLIASRPFNQRKSEASTLALAANAEAWAFRQVTQWQKPIGLANLST